MLFCVSLLYHRREAVKDQSVQDQLTVDSPRNIARQDIEEDLEQLVLYVLHRCLSMLQDQTDHLLMSAEAT